MNSFSATSQCSQKAPGDFANSTIKSDKLGNLGAIAFVTLRVLSGLWFFCSLLKLTTRFPLH